MKVLIMSHNPITDYNSMGKTFMGLFSDFSKDELCQFYIYPTLPNVKCCKSYYRITDKEAFFSILCRKHSGRVICENEITYENTLYENETASNIYRNKELHKEIKIFVRDLIWGLAAWKNKEFRTWISAENPDVIFAAPGASGFFYKLILSVSKIQKIPIVTYVCDDFYFSCQNKKRLIQRFYAKYIRGKIKVLMKKSCHVITISDELVQDYAEEFGCACTTISTGANLKISESIQSGDGKVIAYFGNLQLGRYRSLAEVAKAIDAYNAKYGENICLNIYTADRSKQIDSAFEGISCVQFCGFLAANNMYEEMKKVSVLLHVESFEYEHIERVKYSVSTKIADALASGICLFAYGPKGIASLDYLRRNDCAFVALNQDEMTKKLFACLKDRENREKKAEKALRIAVQNHDSMQQSKRLRSILMKGLS